MTFTVQHKRSGTQDRRPKPADLVLGQVAVNYNAESEGMFFKTDTGTLVKVGPTHVDVSAPTLVNYTDYSIGESWLDSSDPDKQFLKVWDGIEWIPVSSDRANSAGKLDPGANIGVTLTGDVTGSASALFTGEEDIELTVAATVTTTSAETLDPGRNIGVNLTGDVTGSGSAFFDGSTNIVINVSTTSSGGGGGGGGQWESVGGTLRPKQDNEDVVPRSAGGASLGSPLVPWANLYTQDLNLNNETRGGNDIDGSWGSFQIQEGEDSLFLINHRNGKTYRFMLEEV